MATRRELRGFVAPSTCRFADSQIQLRSLHRNFVNLTRHSVFGENFSARARVTNDGQLRFADELARRKADEQKHLRRAGEHESAANEQSERVRLPKEF